MKLFYHLRDQAGLFFLIMSTSYMSYKFSHSMGYVKESPIQESELVGMTLMFVIGGAIYKTMKND